MLARHIVHHSGKCDTYPKVKSAMGGYVEHMCHKSDPTDTDETACAADEESEGEWEEVQAV